MRRDKYIIAVIDKDTGEVIETIKRVLRMEQCGNFSPFFCTYRGNTRCLVESREGDLSDPFRRESSYLSALFIRITNAINKAEGKV